MQRTDLPAPARWFLSSLVLLVLSAPAASAATLALVEGATTAEVRRELDRAGARVLVELGPGAVVTELGAAATDSLALGRLRVTAAADAARATEDESRARRVFRLALAPAEQRTESSAPPCGTRPDAEYVESYRESIATSPWRAELEQRLEPLLVEQGLVAASDETILDRFRQMRGKVGVVLFFLESDASAGNDEDWAAADVDDVLAGVVRSALGWTRVAPPELELSFALAEYGPDSPVSRISVEPSHDVAESEWIHQALANAGFDLRLGAAAYPFEIAAFAEWAREEHFESDVAFPVFVINDRKHRTSWGDPGWPHVNPIFNLMVLNSTYGNDVVFAHEAGHIFYADDEYAANSLYCQCIAQPVGGIRVRASGGEPGETNANCENCNSQPLRCIMLHNAWLGSGIDGPDACWHSRAQIGWYQTATLHVEVQRPAELPAESIDILLDGAVIGSAAARRYLTPGTYSLDVRAPGHSAGPDLPRSVELVNEQELHLRVVLSPSASATAAAR